MKTTTLNSKIVKTLNKANINTIDELKSLTDSQLLSIKGIGNKALNEIKTTIKGLKMEDNNLDKLIMGWNDKVEAYEDGIEMLEMQFECDVISGKEFNNYASKEYKSLEKAQKMFKYKSFLEARKGIVSNIPILDMPNKQDSVSTVTKIDTTINSTTMLAELITKCYNDVDVNVPFQLVDLEYTESDLDDNSNFGVTVELFLTLARLINSPVSRDVKWKPELVTKNRKLIMRRLGVNDSDTIKELVKNLKKLRKSNGYNSFAERDDSNIIIGVMDGSLPKESSVIEAMEVISNIIEIDYEYTIKRFDSVARAKYDRKEKIALLKLDRELDEAQAKRDKLKALQSLVNK